MVLLAFLLALAGLPGNPSSYPNPLSYPYVEVCFYDAYDPLTAINQCINTGVDIQGLNKDLLRPS